MKYQELFTQIQTKKSYLCVGLDTDITKIPPHLQKTEDPIFEFNKAIIEATADLCVAYKLNTAFYEAQGAKGWQSMEKTLKIIPKEIFTIADAKRGDIGNTVDQYAKAFFEQMDFDSITVAPYMGQDSVSPFLKYAEKWVILLALTSNPSSKDFQLINSLGKDNEMFFELVLKTSQRWANHQQMMYVVGATQTDSIQKIRMLIPDHFLLVPGVGVQGGSLESVSKSGMNACCGLLVNSSRGIIYASEGMDFAKAARESAFQLQKEMEECLQRFLPK